MPITMKGLGFYSTCRLFKLPQSWLLAEDMRLQSETKDFITCSMSAEGTASQVPWDNAGEPKQVLDIGLASRLRNCKLYMDSK